MSRRAPIARTSVRDALDSAVIALTAAGCDTPRLDAELLLAEAIGVSRASIVADPGRGLEPDEAHRFMEWTRRRRGLEPVAYILGTKGFRRLELRVDRRVLVPRPETEHLVEAALDLPRGAHVVDVGTGSGAVALALKHERPDLRVTATEASADAIEVARFNARSLGLDVALVHGDLLEPVTGGVDAVVSNPPYVATRERDTLQRDVIAHEPHEALFAGEDGLDLIRRLVVQAAAAGAAFVALEVGSSQSVAVGDLLERAGYGTVGVIADLGGRDRVVVARR